jgi:hypothetical protein
MCAHLDPPHALLRLLEAGEGQGLAAGGRHGLVERGHHRLPPQLGAGVGAGGEVEGAARDDAVEGGLDLERWRMRMMPMISIIVA